MKKEDLKINNLSDKIKSLNPKEIHNWPLFAKVSVGVIVFVVAIGVGVVSDLIPLSDDLTIAKNKEEKLKKEFVDKKKQAVNLDLYLLQLDEVTKDSDALLKQLPDRSEIEKLLLDINQAGVSRGLEFELFKPEKEKIGEFYAELPINIRVRGTYEVVGNFVAEIGQLSRVVLLTDMTMTEKDGFVYLEAVAKTFRYLDSAELEKIRIEKEKKKKEKESKTKVTKPETKDVKNKG